MTTGVGPEPRDDTLVRRLMDGMRLGLALLDAEGRIAIANRAAEALLAYGEGELAGHTLAELHVPGERATAERMLALAREKGRAEDEGWCLRRDGTRVRACFVVATAADGSGGLTLELHEVLVRPDVEADLRRRLASEHEARERAEEASRARDEFLATLSHELRTPLTADILDVARIITGKLRLHIQAVDPAKIAEATLETVRHQADRKGLALGLVVRGDPGPVPADPDRLQQVIGNLLTNAIKFTPERGRVEVRVEARPDWVEIAVTDTGEGITPEMLPHVFERLRQGTALARSKGGLGLGLAIVRHIVELHSGRVDAASEGAGQGSTFTVRLPLLTGRAAPAVAAPSGAATDGPRLHDVTVLVVDDQEDARELMCAVLGRWGAHVVAVESTAAALEALDRFRPDVILSDIEMPGEDGYSLIEKVRARSPERGGTVPAVALTACARTEDRLRSLRAGFHRHVPKPVQPDELAEIVASLAARR